MANIISDETIEYVGILAKLELDDEQKEAAKADMGKMLDYIDKLGELNTDGIEPMSHVFPVQNVWIEMWAVLPFFLHMRRWQIQTGIQEQPMQSIRILITWKVLIQNMY